MAPIYSILPIFITLFSGSSFAQMVISYKGQVELPVPLYTGDGIQLERGRYYLEVRTEKSRHYLAFVRNGEVTALVNAQPGTIEDRADKDPSIPIVGTVYLYPAESLPEESKKQKEPEKKERPRFLLAEHLGSRPWKASLRAYGYSNAARNEVYFVFQEQTPSGEWSRTEFKLFLKKPA